MIEQQYYTRERGGLFNQTDGYDTVAKSPQLKLDYIKKNLHPLCTYDIPYSLQKSGEIDETKYPQNFMVVPLESGETVVGQAVYKSKDFTGLRSTFFMHNYILSEKERRRYIKEPEKLFGINSFASHYQADKGRELPTLAGIPYEVPELFQDRELLFHRLNMTEEIFDQMIAACFVCAHSKKKIFIVLDVALEKLTSYAKALLYHLYMALPWSISERLGVCTYSSKAEPRKNIQITFVDSDALQMANRASKEYIFDFVNKRFASMQEQVENEAYIRLALKYTGNKLAWEKYNKLADELAASNKNASDCNLYFYGRAALLFEMNLFMHGKRSYEIANAKERKNLMKELLDFCKAKLSEETIYEILQLMEYTINLLHESINYGVLWEIDEVKALFQYKLQIYEGNNEQFMHCIQVTLCLLTQAVKEKKLSYADHILGEARCYLRFYQQLIKEIAENSYLKKQLLYYQIDSSLQAVDSVQGLMSVMERWEVVEEILFEDGYYKEAVISLFDTVMTRGKNKIELLTVVQKWCKRHVAEVYERMCDLYESYFLETIQLENELPDERTLMGLRFSHEYREENYDTIKTYQRLRTDIGAMNPERMQLNHTVQQLIKRFYIQNPKKEDFYLLIYAFLGKHKESYELRLDIKKVLAYLKQIDMDLMFEFIIWSKGQEVYLDKSKFDSQVVSFFVALKDKMEKVPKILIKEKLGSSQKTQLLADKINRATQPRLVTFISRYKVGIVILLVIVLGAGGGIGSYCYYQNKKAKALAEAFKEQEVSPEAVAELTKHFSFYNEDLEAKLKEAFEKQKDEQTEENEEPAAKQEEVSQEQETIKDINNSIGD